MKPIGTHNYYVYITTNKNKTVLYVGVSSNLKKRILEHEGEIDGKKHAFTARYNVFYLVYYERFDFIEHAIAREKQIKGWKRLKKNDLISSFNPNWEFLNNKID